MFEGRPDAASPSGAGNRHDQIARSCVAALVVLWVVVALSGLRTGLSGRPVDTADAPPGTVNPNSAPWYELALLPRIGESTARAVVACRDARMRDGIGPAFAGPTDLTEVRGVGPRTVARLANELRFSDEPGQ